MENYIGKICPFCKAEIKEGDAVKACPSCGIPHHEGCWEENHGCTTFGCTEQHYEAQGTNPSEVYSNCGPPLGEEQTSCPKCGQQTDLKPGEDVSAAIEQFNQGIVKKSAKKKKIIKLLIILLIVVGIVVAGVVGGYVFFKGQAEEIIDEITSNNPSSKTIMADYEALTPLGQIFFREKIVDAFVDLVSDNVYTEPSSGIVNESALEKYATYKKIGTALKVTSDDDTNVMSHIDAVLKLKEYVKYNGVYGCMASSANHFAECSDYIDEATQSSSYYLMKLYIGYAHSAAKRAASAARSSSSGDTLCTQFVNAADDFEDELSNMYYGYYSNFSSAWNKITSIVDEVGDAVESVEKIQDRIPKIK